MTRPCQIMGSGIISKSNLNRMGTIGSRNPGCDTSPGLDGDGKRCAERGRVVLHHQRQAQVISAFLGQSQADQATAFLGHEVDGFRGNHF